MNDGSTSADTHRGISAATTRVHSTETSLVCCTPFGLASDWHIQHVCESCCDEPPAC